MDPAAKYIRREQGLERNLGAWQQGMIAIGGAIGVGLFLGSGATIGLAGPAVVITYLIGAVVAITLGLALAEMATVYPVAGSFGVYAEQYIGAWAGLLIRLTYWFAQSLAIGAHMIAIGIYFGYWFPAVPSWVWVVLVSALLVAVNTADIRRFAALEALLSSIKVAAIVVFIVLGIALIAGIGRPGLGLGNLVSHGGFMPKGWSGVWLALPLVITSYIGLEMVAVTAGEADCPEKTVPRALLGMGATLIVMYALATLVVVTVTPWSTLSETGGTLSGSPFVRVFNDIGLPYAGSIMNVVVISASLTSANALLYICTRMLFSLARAEQIPKSMGRLDRRGVPMFALGASAAGMVLATILAFTGQQTFLPMFGTAIVSMLFVWIAIFVCHIRFRACAPVELLAKRSIRVPWHPLPSILAIAIILVVLCLTPFVAGLRWTVPYFLAWCALVASIYSLRKRRGAAVSAAPDA